MLFDESEIRYKEDDFKDDSGLRSRRKDLDFLNQSAAVGRNSIPYCYVSLSIGEKTYRRIFKRKPDSGSILKWCLAS